MGALSQLTARSFPIKIKNLISIIKLNHQIPNEFIETRTALDTNIIINYNNANIRHQKTVTMIRC